MADAESKLTVLLCILDIRHILKKNLSLPWVFFIIKTFLKTNSLFKKTTWAKKKKKEAKYAKSVMILAAMYLNLKRKLKKEKALEVMREIVMKLSYTLDYSIARKNLFFEIPDPFERWLRYRSGLITDGFGLYNDIEDVYISGERMHYIVRRCIFHDVFTETNTPELTSLICDYDQTFHSSVFKEFYFDRNGSWKNTIGHGADVCHYVWKQRNILTKEFKEYLKSLENQDNSEHTGDERRKHTRRQYDRRRGDRRKFDRRKGGRRTSDQGDSVQEDKT